MAMTGMSFLMLLLLGGGTLDSVLQAPPGDLASLLTPKQVLEAAVVQTDEGTLIALASRGQTEVPGMEAIRKAAADLGAADFRTRKAAKDTLSNAGAAAKDMLQEAAQSDDPEVHVTAQELLRSIAGKAREEERSGDAEYLKRLYAIRALGEMKSQKAVPALKAAVDDVDPTIRDAAASALAAIAGKPAPRPDARKLLASMAPRLPQNLSLVAMLDMTSGSKPVTLAKAFAMLAAEMAKQPTLPGVPADEVQRELVQTLPGSRAELQRLIGKAGNMRVDAVTMIMPTQWNLEGDRHENADVYIAWIIQGLCSPKRLRAALASRRGIQKRALDSGRIVLYGRREFAICVLDENTVLWAVGPGRDGRFIDSIVAQLTRQVEGRRVATPLAAKTLGLLKPEGTRLAVATLPDKLFAPAFLPEVQKELTGEIERTRNRPNFETRHDKKLETAFFELVLQSLTAYSLTGRLHVKGAVELKAQFADAEATKKLNTALEGMKASLDGFFTARLENGDDNIKKTFAADLKGKWWTAKLADGVTLTGNLHTARKIFAMFTRAEMRGRARPRPMPMVERLDQLERLKQIEKLKQMEQLMQKR
jgi:HEAT repeats